MTINRPAYEKLIDEDIEWLLNNTKRSLERDHIVDVLRHSVECYYPREYTDEMEFRRTYLCTKMITSVVMTNEEKKELEKLQVAFGRHQDQICPLP